MRIVSLLLIFTFLLCCNTEGSGQKVETSQVIAEKVTTSEWVNDSIKTDLCLCLKTPHIMDVNPNYTFNFSNGKTIVACGWQDTTNDSPFISEFTLSLCADSFIGFWSAVKVCDLKFNSDVLVIRTFMNLSFADNFEYEWMPWLIEKYYFNGQKLNSLTSKNDSLKYNSEQIASTLDLYNNVEWGTQNEPLYEGYAEEMMTLAGRLMLSAISGSNQCREYFFEFEQKFKPDGVYQEIYEDMKSVLLFYN